MKKTTITNASVLLGLFAAASLTLTGNADASWITRQWGRGIGGNDGKHLTHTIHNTVTAVDVAARQSAQAVHIAVGQTGAAVHKGVQDGGRAASQTGEWIGRHPTETVIMAAALASGGFAIAEGCTLSIEGIGLGTIHAGTVAAASLGGSEVGAGGLATYLMLSAGGKTVDSGQETNAPQSLQYDPIEPTERPGAAPATRSSGAERKLGTPQSPTGREIKSSSSDMSPQVQRSIMYEPWISKGAHDNLRFTYGLEVLNWADEVYPIDAVDPSRSDTYERPEARIFDAIVELSCIKDNQDDIAARDQAKDTDIPPVPDFTDLEGWDKENAFDLAGYGLHMVHLTGGDALVREDLIRRLFEKLDEYKQRQKGLGPSWMYPVIPTITAPVTGPQMSAPFP